MNTVARQHISKTLVKACTAAVLLVTCLNAQAVDRNVEDTSDNFRMETMTAIQADLKNNMNLSPSLPGFESEMKRSILADQYRLETLASIHSDLQQNDLFAPSLDVLSAALANDNIDPNVNNLQADHNTNVWSANDTIYPSIASLGSIEFEVRDAASREATMLALNFAIEALQNARSNLTLSQGLTL